MAGPNPPALPGLPLLGNALDFFKDPVKVFRKGYDTLGPVFSIRLGLKRAAVLLGPENNRFFFSETDNILSMREVYKFVIPMFGKVTLAAEPKEYKEQRTILQPTFSGHRMDAYLEVMVEETRNWLDACGETGEFDLWKTFEQLSMYIAASALMGREFRRRLGDEFWALYRDVAGGMEFVLPTNLPLPRFRRRDRAKERLLKMLRPMIAERRRARNGHHDFIQALAEANYSDGRPVSEETIVGMILILVFAAYETTAAQIGWALVQLLQHPDYLSLVLKEQAEVLGPRLDNMTGRNLQRLDRLDWALKETERMRPITTMLWRHTARAYDIGPYHVPRGWITMICPTITHHMPEIFSDPYRYDPERFSPARAEGSKTPFSMVNFGGGFHKCLGVHFARYEMKVVLSMLLQRYALEPPDRLPEPDYSSGIMRPHSPYFIKYRRREMSNLEEAIRLA
jgi:sterol 14-demethylase